MSEPDLSLLFGAAWACYRRLLQQRLATSGFDDIRYPDGELLRLLHYTGGLTVGSIGAAQGVTRQAASKTVDSLVRRGYAVKERLPGGDGRERLVRLTDRGHAVRSVAIGAADSIEAELAADLGPEATRYLRAVLTDLVRRTGDSPPPLIAALSPLITPRSPAPTRGRREAGAVETPGS